MELSISEEMEYRGYDSKPRIIVPSEELLNIHSLIKGYDMDKETYKKESLRCVLKKARVFFDKYYELHKVPYELYKKVGSCELSFESQISPFRIPIKKVDEDVYYGKLGEIIISGGETRSLFRKIELPKEITEVATLSYVHEITHTQDNHIYGSIRNYYNTELLSIFNELLCAGSIDDGGRMSYLNDVVRLHNLKYGIKFLQDGLGKDEEWYDELVEASCYVESTVKAYNMFIDYYEGDRLTREYIILMIQKVFDGEITLEQCLEALDITYENSLNAKRLAKFLGR